MSIKNSVVWLFVIVALSLVVAGDASAQNQKMYSWTDENGVVHFTDKKPEGREVNTRDIPAAPQPAASNPYQQVDAGPSVAQQKREEIARNAQEANAARALNDAQCASMRQEVARLEPNRRVFYTDEKGETVRMDDVERTNRVAELKAQIAQNCK